MLLASPVLAQSDSNDQNKQANESKSQKMEQAARAEFKQLDKNSDQKLQWDEIEPQVEQSDLKNKWNQNKLMSEYEGHMVINADGQELGEANQVVMSDEQVLQVWCSRWGVFWVSVPSR
ncbi:hypothetical protein [Marinobacter sp. ATCH36]|uniref:hypothetical protein n=1 Tax=Marinobacter sp. ATCH36 TaxID=2945106 RepID=UPI0020223AA0|nr:hypothetical protein [Marinobacter sp. ATCH36]MCL7944697.1 hypothetical protein [Marinobacter sp. ATCH36]